MYIGQRIAIPVLDRHIKTSSGKCANEAAFSTDCVMADAIRDRFEGADEVSLGGVSGEFYLGDTNVSLHFSEDMKRAVGVFDETLDSVLAGDLRFGEAFDRIRERTPRVVHATISAIF